MPYELLSCAEHSVNVCERQEDAGKMNNYIMSKLDIWCLWSSYGLASNSELFDYTFNVEWFCCAELVGRPLNIF